MAHTLMLSKNLLNWEQYDIMAETFYNYARLNQDSICYPSKPWKSSNITFKGITFKGFEQNGIIMFLNVYSNPLFDNYTWEIKINPKSLDGIDRISVANEDDIRKCFNMLDSLLFNKLNMPFNHKDFKLKRIDPCCNYHFKSHNEAELYMSLLKKGAVLNGFNILEGNYNPISHRTVTHKNSIYCENKSKSVTINIYIKGEQLKNDPYINEDYDYESAFGIVRFEVQCKRRKLVGSKKRLHVEDLCPEPFITDSFNFYILKYYLAKIFMVGNYFKYSDAMFFIENSDFHNKSKELMLILLYLTSVRNGLQKAKLEMLAMGYNDNDIKSTLHRFNILNINPVTIPVKYEIDYLRSPVNILSELNDEF